MENKGRTWRGCLPRDERGKTEERREEQERMKSSDGKATARSFHLKISRSAASASVDGESAVPRLLPSLVPCSRIRARTCHPLLRSFQKPFSAALCFRQPFPGTRSNARMDESRKDRKKELGRLAMQACGVLQTGLFHSESLKGMGSLALGLSWEAYLMGDGRVWGGGCLGYYAPYRGGLKSGEGSISTAFYRGGFGDLRVMKLLLSPCRSKVVC